MKYREKIKNVPNILSALRILMVPVFIAVFFSGTDDAKLRSAVVYAVAATTDVIDGWVARRFNLITNLGRILDPLGDKLMALAMVSCLAVTHSIPMWALVFYAVKELTMMFGGFVIHQKIKADMPAANIIGKAATVSINFVGLSLLIFDIPKHISDIMVLFAICLAFMAFGTYVLNFVGVARAASAKNGKEQD